jgi:DNA (cytosine-5)-methyltransferase 1
MGPRLAILENVRGHLSLGFDSVLADLASVGWSARWGVVRASDAGACHQRARLFIVAYPKGNGWNQGWTESAGLLRGPDASQRGHGIPAHPDESVGHEWGGTARGRRRGPADSRGAVTNADLAGLEGPQSARGRHLPHWSPTAHAASSERRTPKPEHLREASRAASKLRECVAWGDYGPAIARWERVIGRPAPAPTETGRTGNPRLAPRFVEWMMGLPDGWVTDPAIGISRNEALRALGNGVVPQQAALALDVLLQGTTDDLRQSLATV